MPLAYLSGMVTLHKHWKCVDLDKDLCYFGIRSYEDEEVKLVKSRKLPVIEPKLCRVEALPFILEQMYSHFNHNQNSKYWVSFDIDGVDAGSFQSTGTPEGNGLSLDFTYKLFEDVIPKSVGMDFTEVNFELSDGNQRIKDEQTFREIFEFIVEKVNSPVLG